jgi:hypothetical protein
VDPPACPARDDAAAGAEPAPATRWGPRTLVAALVLLVVVIVGLHLTGFIGPAAH